MSSSKGSSPSPLSSAITEGSDDLLIEILLFLPAKSLVTFKTVSKRWRSLISDPLFCRRHTLHHPRRRCETQTLLLIGIYRSKYIVCDPTIPRLYPSQLQFGLPSVGVMQSCNGLLLLRSYEESKGFRYYVFNPTTMQKSEVSPLPNESYAGLFLMFDPYLSPHYRVVYFEYTEKGKNLVYLYKSEEHEWNKLVGEAIEMDVSCHSGFYFNGGICFDSLRCLSIFTPDDCKVTTIPDIPERGRGQQRSRVMECNGVVFCLTLSWREGVVLLTVWEMEMEIMETERRRWRKKYEVDMNPIMAKCDWSAIYFRGMVRADEKEEEDYVLMFRLPGKMMIYRFSHGVFEDCDDWCLGVAHHFIGTLAPV